MTRRDAPPLAGPPQATIPIRPRAQSPAVADYQDRLRERRGLPPVAGGPSPPIPRLDSEHVPGMTMAHQAMLERELPATGLPGMPSVDLMGQPPASGILPGDILPPEAQNDPQFIRGSGSGYAFQQPAMAKKYGVIRKGQHVFLNDRGAPTTGKLREETLEGLKALGEMQEKAKAANTPEQIAEREAENGPAGAGARVAGGDSRPADRAATHEEAVARMVDPFDLDTYRQMLTRDILNNQEQREIVEARCKPLSLDDLVVNGFVLQEVPIVMPRQVGTNPTKGFVPTFRSIDPIEDLAIKRMLMEEATKLQVDERYFVDKYQLMTIVLGVYAINALVLPDYRDGDGLLVPDLFWKKFNKLMKYPLPMIASLGVHNFYFDIRVRKLFVADKVGNG